MNPQKFEGSETHGEMDKVYVVLDQIGANNEKELSFGLKIVNKEGKQLASNSNNALIVTENSVGLINIRSWISMNQVSRGIEVNRALGEKLREMEVKAEFQANASDIDIWLEGGSGMRKDSWEKLLELSEQAGKAEMEGGNVRQEELKNLIEKLKKELGTKDERTISSLFSSMWFDNKDAPARGGFIITAEWNPWCGTQNNKYDKRLKEDRNQSNLVGGDYKNAKGSINLRVGPIRNSGTGDKWALIPIGKPIMKINLSPGSFNNETIEGTLEPMKDDLSPFI